MGSKKKSASSFSISSSNSLPHLIILPANRGSRLVADFLTGDGERDESTDGLPLILNAGKFLFLLVVTTGVDDTDDAGDDSRVRDRLLEADLDALPVFSFFCCERCTGVLLEGFDCFAFLAGFCFSLTLESAAGKRYNRFYQLFDHPLTNSSIFFRQSIINSLSSHNIPFI